MVCFTAKLPKIKCSETTLKEYYCVTEEDYEMSGWGHSLFPDYSARARRKGIINRKTKASFYFVKTLIQAISWLVTAPPKNIRLK